MGSKITEMPKELDRTGVRTLVTLQNEAWEYISNLFMCHPFMKGERKMCEDELVAHKEFAELVLMKKLTIDCNGDIFVDGKEARRYIQSCGYDDPWKDE